MTTRVLLPASTNQGYGPEQISTGATLGELLEALEDAVERYGADALVVLDQGQRYGAGYGYLPRHGDLRAVGECEYCETVGGHDRACPGLEEEAED
jgi:hypothetical protein